MVFPVFYEASGTSARYQRHVINRVEACRPRGYCAAQSSSRSALWRIDCRLTALLGR